MSRRARTVGWMLAALGALGLIAPAASFGAMDFFWTPGTGTAATQVLRLSAVPPATSLPKTTFWSFGGHFTGGTGDDGWYMGMQTDGANFSGQDVGQQAIFSVWNATAEKGGSFSTCASFSGEGNGLSCHVPFTLVPGDSYRYAIREVAAHTFLATITNLNTGVNRSIGQITAPAADTVLDDTFNFIENFGSVPCAQQTPAGAAWFAKPALTGGSSAITGITPDPNNGSCATGFAPTADLSGVGAANDTTYTPPAPQISFAAQPAIAATVGRPVSQALHATDSSGLPIAYTATGLPPGLAISSTGLITGTPATAGGFQTTVRGTDALGAVGTIALNWSVATPPVPVTPPAPAPKPPINVVKTTAVHVTRAKLTGLAKRRPKLVLALAADAGKPPIRSVSITLPKRVAPAHSRKRLRKGIELAAKPSGQFAAAAHGRTLTVTLHRASPSVTIKLGGRALTDTRTEARKIRRGRLKSLTLKLAVVNASHQPSRLSVRLHKLS